MLISVVVCTHKPDNYPDLKEVVDSIMEQTYSELEIIIIVDGSEELYQKTMDDYANQNAIRPILLRENVGVSGARNAGINASRGDIIAFLDDDAVANRTWIEILLMTYEEHKALAVGGKVLPLWLCDKPNYLPEELYWLVGSTHDGFAEKEASEVRNTFGPNMSFRRDVFEKIGVFNENFGFARRRKSFIQAEEAELGLRMKHKLGKGVIYNPHAIVYHKIRQSKLGLKILLRRAFYQGYSKALLSKLNKSGHPTTTEWSYLRALLFKCVPRRVQRLYRVSEAKKLAFLAVTVTSVGLGFLYGYMKRT